MSSPFSSFDPIDPECAMGLIYNWLEYTQLNSAMAPIDCGFKRSFVIRFDDLEKLRHTNGYHGIRIYFGKENITEEGEMRLILVPVDKSCKDIPGAEIYDFSMPCPPTCSDPDSHYYKGKHVDDICKRKEHTDDCPA